MIVKQAKSGRRVVRLMAGDPFVYASGPEEAQACVKAGVGFEIVPGVSAVTAVPAYAGVPLTTKTDREVAVVKCTDAKIDWSQYADDRTLVLLSAVSAIETRGCGPAGGGSRPRDLGGHDPGGDHGRPGHDHLDPGRHRGRRRRRRG